MAMSVGSGGAGSRPDINVTPLVDVVLVLLIIFMVVTPLLEREMPMRLPEIEKELTPPPPDQPPEENVVLYVTKADELRYNGQVITVEDIETKLGPVLRSLKDGQPRVLFFTADDDAKYELAIRALDAVRAAGGHTIAFLADVPEGAGGAPGAPGAPAAPGAPPTPAPASHGVK